MLYPTAGSRLFIANLPDTAYPSVAASEWVEIGEAESFGSVGFSWDTSESFWKNAEVVQTLKNAKRPSQMQLVTASDPTDPGQRILWRAGEEAATFPFRLVLPLQPGQSAAPERLWDGLVVSVDEAFDTANSVVKLLWGIVPQSNILRKDAIL